LFAVLDTKLIKHASMRQKVLILIVADFV
jgi:hypothetical protein